MTSLSDTVYYLLPPKIQNIAVSYYGRKLYNRRYSEPFSSLLGGIQHRQALSTDELMAHQLNELNAIFHYSVNQIPYYRDLVGPNNISVNQFRDLSELKELPILRKDVLLERPDDFLPNDIRQRSYFLQNTSGSTGKPLSTHVDEKTYKMAMALVMAFENAHGVKAGEPRATFAGRMVQRIDQTAPPFWRLNRAENQMIFSSYHLNDSTVQAYADELNRFRPVEYIGYPSALYTLSELLIRHNIQLTFTPKVVISNSETLLEWQRDIIEKALGVRVSDYYGTAEYVVFAGQCEAGNYHVDPSLGLLEVVDENQNPVTDQEGDMVCTSLCNYAMPLIRYKIGDVATVSSDDCRCGSACACVSSIRGRIDDIVVTTDNRKIGRLDHIFKGLSGIRESQIIQTEPNKCVIKVVKSDPNGNIDETLLLQNMEERVGKTMQLDVVYTDEIMKGKNGKFKAVVNLT